MDFSLSFHLGTVGPWHRNVSWVNVTIYLIRQFQSRKHGAVGSVEQKSWQSLMFCFLLNMMNWEVLDLFSSQHNHLTLLRYIKSWYTVADIEFGVYCRYIFYVSLWRRVYMLETLDFAFYITAHQLFIILSNDMNNIRSSQLPSHDSAEWNKLSTIGGFQLLILKLNSPRYFRGTRYSRGEVLIAQTDRNNLRQELVTFSWETSEQGNNKLVIDVNYLGDTKNVYTNVLSWTT